MMKRAVYPLLLLLIFGISYYLRSVFIPVPLFRDEGGYGYIAQVMQHGGLLYRDVVDIKPPGVYALYYAAQLLFGWGSGPGVRLFASLICLLTIPFIYLLTKKMSSSGAGLVAALLFGLITPAPHLMGCFAFCEVFMFLPIVAAFYLFMLALDEKGAKSIIFFTVSGFLLGLAFIIKPVALFFLLPPCAYALLLYQDRKEKQMLYGAALFLGGFACSMVLLFLWLVHNGLLADFYEVNVKFNSVFASSYPDEIGTTYAGRLLRSFRAQFIGNNEMVFLMILSLLYWILGPKTEKNYRILLVLWFITALAGVCMSGRFYFHYYLLLLPALAISSALTFHHMMQKAPQMARLFLIFISLIFLIYYGKYMSPFLFSYSPDKTAQQIFNSENNTYAEKLAGYLRAHTADNDTIFVWGMEFQVYFYAGRHSSTRHYNLYNIIVLAASPEPVARELLRHYQDETIADFKRTPPRYIIIVLPNLSLKYQTEDVYLTTYVSGILKEQYVREPSIGHYDIFVRKGK